MNSTFRSIIGQNAVRILSWVWLLAGAVLGLFCLLPAGTQEPSKSFIIAQSATLSSTKGSSSLPPGVGTRNIEDIQVGDRVLARNPEVSDEDRRQWTDPDPSLLQRMKLRMLKPDGGVLSIEMLRPTEWLTERNAIPGNRIFLDLPEMGASGEATVVSVRPCPPHQIGRGPVVTATFSHPPSTAVLDVRFEGATETIGVTDNHRFWSVDRQQFVPIGKMSIGERVETFQGETKRIEQKLPRPGPQLVYNLEVYGEHVYFVGQCGVLVHNNYDNTRRTGVDYGSLDGDNIGRYNRYLDNYTAAKPLAPGDWLVMAQRNWASASKGPAFERAVLENLGVTGPKTPLGNVIPDLPVGNRFGVTDIKNVKEITNSTNKYNVKQLEEFYKEALKTPGRPFNLIISPNTQSISQSVVDMINQTKGKVFQFDAATSRWTSIDISSIVTGGWKR